MSIRCVTGSMFMLFLICSCTAMFVLHSLYWIFRTASQSVEEQIKYVNNDQLSIPALIVCNPIPFTRDGLTAVNSNLEQDSSLRYLMQWTNPSLVEQANFNPAPASFIQQGLNTVMDSLNSQNTRNLTILSMLYQCQSIINSCNYKGIQLSSFECCRNMKKYISTTAGLCFVWQDDSMTQNSTGTFQQFSIVFQMSRNSWYSSYVQVHPGIDVYLQESGADTIRLGSQLQNPIKLMDKRGIRLLMHKQQKADVRRTDCGYSLGDARRSDEHALQHNNTNLLMCNMMVAMMYCNCHPLQAEMLQYDAVKFSDFAVRVKTTQVCSVEAYDACARRYVDFSRPEYRDENVPKDLVGYEDVKKCISKNHRYCLDTSYTGTLQAYELPEEYQSTQDFVSRLVLEYSTMKTTQILVTKSPDIYELLSFIGYNIALWFCIGHILWSLFHMVQNICCPRHHNKISPMASTKRQSVSSPTPILVSPPNPEEPPAPAQVPVD